jgi:hypothetical protein
MEVNLLRLTFLSRGCDSCCRRKRKKDHEYSLSVLMRTLVLLLIFSTLGMCAHPPPSRFFYPDCGNSKRFGAAVGIVGNMKFTSTLKLLTTITVDAGTDVVDLGDGIVSFVDLIPTKVEALFNDTNALLDKVGNVTNSTTEIVSDLSSAEAALVQVEERLATLQGSTAEIASLRILVSSSVVGVNSSLTDIARLRQLAVNDLAAVSSETRSQGAQILSDTISTTSDISSSLSSVTDDVSDYVEEVKKYSQMVVSYDTYRLAGFMAILVLPFLCLVLGFLGFFWKHSWPLLLCAFRLTTSVSFRPTDLVSMQVRWLRLPCYGSSDDFRHFVLCSCDGGERRLPHNQHTRAPGVCHFDHQRLPQWYNL